MMVTGDRGFRRDSALYRPVTHFLRGSLGRFATGVAVVTFDAVTFDAVTFDAAGGGGAVGGGVGDGVVRRQGITVNSFTSVSMEPPLVLVAIQRTVRSHDLLVGRPFAINVLGAEQRDLAQHFAGRPSVEPVWIEGRIAPRLGGALSYFECTPWAAYDGGDHTLFVGEVHEFDYRSGDALGFVAGQFCTIPEQSLGHESLF